MVSLFRLIQGRGVLDTECLWFKSKYKYQKFLQKGVCVASVGVQRECMQGLPEFYLQGWAFLLLWVLSWCVRRVCTGLACILFAGCCQNYSAKLVRLIANSSWFILLLGNVRPELHTEHASFLVPCLTHSLMYYSYVTYFKIINKIFKKIFSC